MPVLSCNLSSLRLHTGIRRAKGPNVGFAHIPTVVVGFALLHPPYGNCLWGFCNGWGWWGMLCVRKKYGRERCYDAVGFLECEWDSRGGA